MHKNQQKVQKKSDKGKLAFWATALTDWPIIYHNSCLCDFWSNFLAQSFPFDTQRQFNISFSTNMPQRKIRSLCSGCFREGKNLKRLGTYFKRDFFDYNFMCCSQNCASLIKSKKPYSTLINNWPKWAPTISVTWIIAYQIYKNLVKNIKVLIESRLQLR